MYTTSICISISYITTAIFFTAHETLIQHKRINAESALLKSWTGSRKSCPSKQYEILPFEMIMFLQYALHWILQLNHQHLTYLLWSQNFILWKLFELNEPALMINVVYDRSIPQNLMWLFFMVTLLVDVL